MFHFVPDKGTRNFLDPKLSTTDLGWGAVEGEGQTEAGPGPPSECGSSSRDSPTEPRTTEPRKTEPRKTQHRMD
jgi:hypothetical protein